MIFLDQQHFLLGEISVSPAALRALDVDTICRAIDRHVCADFGLVSAEERAANEDGLRRGLSVRSMFRASNGILFCVETTGNRLQTRIFLKGILP